MTLVHYGSDSYDRSAFKPIEDTGHWVKPKGGLWGCPVASSHSWRSWCEAEEFRIESLNRSFQFEFSGRLMVIDGPEDLDKLVWKDTSGFLGCVLFEPLLHRGVDGIYLTERGERETRWSSPRNLYGWDCESVLVMNPECVRELARI